MDSLMFTYWLQGFVELNDGKMPTPEQWQSIQDHLQTVFRKITPPVKERDIHEERYCKQNNFFQPEDALKAGNLPLNWESILITC